MNITLIQPVTDGTDIEPPKSLACLAAYLDRAGHNVRLIDLQIESIHENWESIFSSEPIDLVGFTAMTPQIKGVHEIAQKVRTLKPDIPIIIGGVHASVLPEQTLQDFPAFDICVIGEGEQTLLELVSRYERNEPMAHDSVLGIAFHTDEKNIITPPRPRLRDLDSLPNHHQYYDFDYYLNHNTLGFVDKSASLIISRGCPYNCQFCATRNFWTNRYVCKSVDGALDEIRNVMRLGAKGIKFRDSTFVINKKWVREFCDKIIAEKLKFPWSMNARVDLVDYDLFKQMKEAGLVSVFLGAESGSQRILDFYGKGITPKQTEDAFEICRKLKIRTGAYWMLGALPETREDMEATYQLGTKIKADQNFVFIFMPLPGAELYQYYLDQGCELEYDKIGWDKAVFSSAAGFSREELEAMRDKWYDDFNKKPHILIRGMNLILSIRSKEDFKDLWGKIARRLSIRS
ncbi:MAG: B12-binding domain-containing radical SAM protein [Desulfobacteraceae bacterium]|nr:B12-binding domain-containing radical SAM protein [Desulfobacteraceae bacterium]MBC2754822.1 B12-binding domain-containing radical SAM protein [Desulfobacteraceae bacterium]